MQFTPDVRTLLILEGPTTARQLTIRVAATGELARRVAAPNDWPLFRVAPDGRRVLFIGTRTLLRLWDTETGRPLFTQSGHEWGIRTVAVMADGRTAVTSDKVELRGWNLA